MKYFIVIIILIPFYALGQNLIQPYGGTNAKWVYDWSGAKLGVTEVYKSRDTIVDGQTILVFEKRSFFEENGEIMIQERLPVYLTSENGLVRFSVDLNNFDTLFNFNLVKNDSWSIPKRNSLTGQPTGELLTRFVVDTFSLVINGQSVFCQSTNGGEGDIFTDTIYSVFGSRYSYILPFENFELYGEGSLLRCFTNDEIGSLDFEDDLKANFPNASFTTFEYDCGVISSSTTPVRNTNFSLYPNPAADYLSLQSGSTPIENVKVYNLEGLLMTEKQLVGQEVELDISNLASGVYILLINDTYYEKIVVQE